MSSIQRRVTIDIQEEKKLHKTGIRRIKLQWLQQSFSMSWQNFFSTAPCWEGKGREWKRVKDEEGGLRLDWKYAIFFFLLLVVAVLESFYLCYMNFSWSIQNRYRKAATYFENPKSVCILTVWHYLHCWRCWINSTDNKPPEWLLCPRQLQRHFWELCIDFSTGRSKEEIKGKRQKNLGSALLC